MARAAGRGIPAGGAPARHLPPRELAWRVGLGAASPGALASPCPRQKLDLERETIELVHTEPTDVAQLPSRVPREAARYHFFLYRHTHEGDPLESVGEWRGGPPGGAGEGLGCRGGPPVHPLRPGPRSVHLLDAGVQVQHPGTHALLQLQEPPPRLGGAGLPAGDLQEGGRPACRPEAACLLRRQGAPSVQGSGPRAPCPGGGLGGDPRLECERSRGCPRSRGGGPGPRTGRVTLLASPRLRSVTGPS